MGQLADLPLVAAPNTTLEPITLVRLGGQFLEGGQLEALVVRWFRLAMSCTCRDLASLLLGLVVPVRV